MDTRNFRAANIFVKTGSGRAPLVEAFNAWVEQEVPAAIVHVHYYHDLDACIRGYQIIYERGRSTMPSQAPEMINRGRSVSASVGPS